MTAPGGSPSTLGMASRAGGSKTAPAGCTVTMKRGCWAKAGLMGTLSGWTEVTLTTPSREPSGKVTEPGAISRAKPGTSGRVRVPPVVALTRRPRSTSIGNKYSGRRTPLTRPGTSMMRNSRRGQVPARGVVSPLTWSSTRPGGAGARRK